MQDCATRAQNVAGNANFQTRRLAGFSSEVLPRDFRRPNYGPNENKLKMRRDIAVFKIKTTNQIRPKSTFSSFQKAVSV